MRINDLIPDKIKEAIEEFYQQANRVVSEIMKIVANENFSIPRVPRKLGVYEFKYFFAANIDEMFRFALGGLQASSKYIMKICDGIEKVLFYAPYGKLQIDEKEWRETVMGFGVYLARARAKLRDKREGMLTEDEIIALTTTDEETVKKALSKLELVDDKYMASEVQDLFKELGEKI